MDYSVVQFLDLRGSSPAVRPQINACSEGPQDERGEIVTDRVACRKNTQSVRERKDPQSQAKDRYRREFLRTLQAACEGGEVENALVDKFTHLANTLEDSKALALPAIYTMGDGSVLLPPGPASESATNELSAASGKRLHCHAELLEYRPTQTGLIHPLIVALLAYKLGGPISAANSAYADTWQMPVQTGPDANVDNFYWAHAIGDLFDDHRIALVWENCNGVVRCPSGTHHIFLGSDITPGAPIKAATTDVVHAAHVPITILYDMNDGTLAYQSQDKDALRQSLTLDFHLYVKPMDEEKHVSTLNQTEPKNIELLELLTSSPVPNYELHFLRLLCAPNHLKAMRHMLSRINPPAPCLQPPPSDTAFKQRIKAYTEDNVANTPPELLSIREDTRVSGTYASSKDFHQSLSNKARRDVHLGLGWDLFPHEEVDATREFARKYFRDMPRKAVARRIARYLSTAAKMPYSSRDLLSTAQLQSLAARIGNHCLELVSNGYVCDSGVGVLPSIPSLSRALGSALNGRKEARNGKNSWYEESGFQIYRTRCLYLFWCADFVVKYLGNPKEGEFMIEQLGEKAITDLETTAMDRAKLLLRNWIAWSMFVEELPKGGFGVQSSSS